MTAPMAMKGVDAASEGESVAAKKMVPITAPDEDVFYDESENYQEATQVAQRPRAPQQQHGALAEATNADSTIQHSGSHLLMNGKDDDDCNHSESAAGRDREDEAVHPNSTEDKASSSRDSGWATLLSHCHQFRQTCGRIVNHPKVQLLVVVLIALNAATMGIATFDFVRLHPFTNDVFEVMDAVFLILFTVELAFQAVYHGFYLLTDGWLVFDLIVIVMSWAFAQVQIIRAFRVFRAFRLVTRIEVMKNLVVGTFIELMLPCRGRFECCTPFSRDLASRSFPRDCAHHSDSTIECHSTHGSHRIVTVFDFLHIRCHVYTAVQRPV
jgi:Ion transport protein